MNRRSAIATAAAATMTLLSGFVVVGAHTGALGLGGAPAPAVAQPTAAPVAERPATPAAIDTTRTATATKASPAAGHAEERDHGYEHEGRESDD